VLNHRKSNPKAGVYHHKIQPKQAHPMKGSKAVTGLTVKEKQPVIRESYQRYQSSGKKATSKILVSQYRRLLRFPAPPTARLKRHRDGHFHFRTTVNTAASIPSPLQSFRYTPLLE
jgi:hypothetical protein